MSDMAFKIMKFVVFVVVVFNVSVENEDKYVLSWTDRAVLTLINRNDGAALNANIITSACTTLTV